MTRRLPAQACDCGQRALQGDVGQSGSHATEGRGFLLMQRIPLQVPDRNAQAICANQSHAAGARAGVWNIWLLVLQCPSPASSHPLTHPIRLRSVMTQCRSDVQGRYWFSSGRSVLPQKAGPCCGYASAIVSRVTAPWKETCTTLVTSSSG